MNAIMPMTVGSRSEIGEEIEMKESGEMIGVGKVLSAYTEEDEYGTAVHFTVETISGFPDFTTELDCIFPVFAGEDIPKLKKGIWVWFSGILNKVTTEKSRFQVTVCVVNMKIITSDREKQMLNRIFLEGILLGDVDIDDSRFGTAAHYTIYTKSPLTAQDDIHFCVVPSDSPICPEWLKNWESSIRIVGSVWIWRDDTGENTIDTIVVEHISPAEYVWLPELPKWLRSLKAKGRAGKAAGRRKYKVL